MKTTIKDMGQEFRVAKCSHTKKLIVQCKQESNTWLCLHHDTAQEDAQAVNDFWEKYNIKPITRQK